MSIETNEDVYRKFLGIVQSTVEGPILLHMDEEDGGVILKVAGNEVYSTDVASFLEMTANEIIEAADLTKKR